MVGVAPALAAEPKTGIWPPSLSPGLLLVKLQLLRAPHTTCPASGNRTTTHHHRPGVLLLFKGCFLTWLGMGEVHFSGLSYLHLSPKSHSAQKFIMGILE